LQGIKAWIGGAIWKALKNQGYENLVGKTSKELDLKDQQAVVRLLQH